MRPSTSLPLAFVIAVALAAPGVAAERASHEAGSIAVALAAAAPMSLLPDAAEALRRKILVQCGLGDKHDTLPWYFHFEYGRALLDAGDARRAVEQLSQSVELNPVPRADKRLYGMWFTDYLPYFRLAEAHAQLDNWPCAAQAMQLSRSSGEAGIGRVDPQRVRALQEEIDRNVETIGACNLRDHVDTHYAAVTG